MLPTIKKEFSKSQKDEINKAYQSGGKLVIKQTRKQVEGGFLGTLASIGIPMAISLVSKMFGSGLQVVNNNHQVQEMFMYHQFKHTVKDTIHINHLLFLELGKMQLEWE